MIADTAKRFADNPGVSYIQDKSFSAWAYADYTPCLSSSVFAMGREADVNLTGTPVMVTLD